MTFTNRINSSWKLAKLEDLVFFQRGFDISQAEQKEGDVPVISSSGVKSYHSEAKVQAPGVVIGRKGTLGSVHFADRDYWPHSTTLWSKKLNGNDPKYIYYFLKTLSLERFDVGNANPTLNRNHIHKLEICIPPLKTQEAIADILSKYDDLIENNRRRIELLEESARLLYREWFVYLRFPGHEHTPIIDGIPQGWEKIPLGDALTLQRGFDLPTKERKPGQFPIYASTGINGYHNVFKVKAPGIVTGRSGSLGTVLFVDEDFWPLNTTLWIKEFKKIDAYFALHLLRLLNLEQYNGGAAVPTLNRNDVHRIEVSLPGNQLKSLFTEFVTPIYSQIKKIELYNNKLQEARDLLLPRLMSGEIAV